jgi:hypothetical protein
LIINEIDILVIIPEKKIGKELMPIPYLIC